MRSGATVTQVAHCHEVTCQQIYKWRHELKKKGLWSADTGALFSPLDIPVAGRVTVLQPEITEAPPPSAVELRLLGGRYFHFYSTMDLIALTSLIRAVEIAQLVLATVVACIWTEA